MDDIRIKLSALWIARMLTGIQGDVIRLMDPAVLEDIISGETAVPVTAEVLASMGILMLIPIAMVFLSLELKYKPTRWLNIIIAVIFIAIDGIGFIMPRPLYENVMGIGYVLFCALIVWFAFKWTEKEE